jgi:hypothetical protein
VISDGDELTTCHVCSIPYCVILVKRGVSEQYLRRLCYPFGYKAWVVWMFVCKICCAEFWNGHNPFHYYLHLITFYISKRNELFLPRIVSLVAGIHTYIHSFIHKCIIHIINAYIHIYIHTDMHTYIGSRGISDNSSRRQCSTKNRMTYLMITSYYIFLLIVQIARIATS